MRFFIFTFFLVVCFVLSAPMYLLGFAFVLLVATCVIREDHLLQRFLQLKWMQYIGRISYGMYMFNMLCLNIAKKSLGWVHAGKGFELFFTTLLITVLVAGLSFRYYESFFLRLKYRFER